MSKNNEEAINKRKNIHKQIETSLSKLVKELIFLNDKVQSLHNKYGINKKVEPKRNEDLFLNGPRCVFDEDILEYTKEISTLLMNHFRKIKESALDLSELLEDTRKEYYQTQIKSIDTDIEKIQKKKYINVKEFTEIYGKSSDWQRDRRSRIKNKLPFMQEKLGSNIMYKVEEVEIWFENNS